MKVDRHSSDYAEVQDYLFGLKAHGIKFGIDRMRLFVEALGHPERAVPTIHLSGTNGKGSTSAMLDAILHAAGWRTGLYTSPHLVRLGERVQVNRALLTEAELVAFTRELRPIAEDVSRNHPDDHPSFFEFMTAMAFLQFQRKQCDIGIIEVGMGGRLDATNVVLPDVAAITSISLDHCEMLGDSVEKIAMEKAGIIKPGRPVVIGRLPAGAEQVIRQIAAERGSRVWSVREEFGDDIARYPTTNLECDYQRWNAATATLVARALGGRWRLTDEIIRRGLQHAYWPGRWQRGTVGGRPIIYDASHNPEGAQVLDVNLRRLVAETGRAPVVIVGALGIARAQPLIETVCRHARGVYFVVPHQARACNYEQLEALVPAGYRGHVSRATVEELFPSSDRCTAGDAGDLIVVTGSIYLLGEVLARVEPARGAGEGRLQDF
ncbi:MAG TPA: folylpolyglutamate synthase/dihydrofolate synthase family protein [Opitutaceae bacterium]|nr:folylpolyglutamate synthase/dihydrofolate synthase family protein [Opitutaceae bacterium]